MRVFVLPRRRRPRGAEGQRAGPSGEGSQENGPGGAEGGCGGWRQWVDGASGVDVKSRLPATAPLRVTRTGVVLSPSSAPSGEKITGRPDSLSPGVAGRPRFDSLPP